ncbi:hypothetical protein, partial [Faecalibaculum rodentium]|uniref:hypothetical protein n=1 Tax=Faecalibaculum rodentium TaxID=1702221 RepID=UPI0023F2B049
QKAEFPAFLHAANRQKKSAAGFWPILRHWISVIPSHRIPCSQRQAGGTRDDQPAGLPPETRKRSTTRKIF